jgi:hypothetical protein
MRQAARWFPEKKRKKDAEFASYCKPPLLPPAETNICGVDYPPPLPLPNLWGAYLYCLQADGRFLVGEQQVQEIGLPRLAHLDGHRLKARWD